LPQTTTIDCKCSQTSIRGAHLLKLTFARWGQHIHHGLFTADITTKEAAQINLIDHLLQLATVPDNATILDVGCGIGGTSRYLAKTRSANVTGITISSKQVEIARRITAEECSPPSTSTDPSPVTSPSSSLTSTPHQPFTPGKVRYLHLDADLLVSTFPPSTFTHVWISECLSHLPSKSLFFSSASTLLSPSGQLIVADWFKSSVLTPEQQSAIIQPIEDGMLLPPLHTMDDYVALAEQAGLKCVKGPEDLSEGVAKTWDISWELVSSPALWAFAISQGRDGLAFLQSFRAMRRGYREGAFRYGVMVFEKVGGEDGYGKA
jgi:tocopherol O-methyltransferase